MVAISLEAAAAAAEESDRGRDREDIPKNQAPQGDALSDFGRAAYWVFTDRPISALPPRSASSTPDQLGDKALIGIRLIYRTGVALMCKHLIMAGASLFFGPAGALCVMAAFGLWSAARTACIVSNLSPSATLKSLLRGQPQFVRHAGMSPLMKSFTIASTLLTTLGSIAGICGVLGINPLEAVQYMLGQDPPPLPQAAPIPPAHMAAEALAPAIPASLEGAPYVPPPAVEPYVDPYAAGPWPPEPIDPAWLNGPDGLLGAPGAEPDGRMPDLGVSEVVIPEEVVVTETGASEAGKVETSTAAAPLHGEIEEATAADKPPVTEPDAQPITKAEPPPLPAEPLAHEGAPLPPQFMPPPSGEWEEGSFSGEGWGANPAGYAPAMPIAGLFQVNPIVLTAI